MKNIIEINKIYREIMAVKSKTKEETNKNDKVVFEDDDENNNESDNDEDIESKILKGQELLNYLPPNKEEDTQIQNEIVDINAIDNVEEAKTLENNVDNKQNNIEEQNINEENQLIKGNKYKDSVKNIDPEILSTIKHKLSNWYCAADIAASHICPSSISPSPKIQ